MAANLVLGAYFAGKPHPQHGWSVSPKYFDYFADWYHSIRRLGLNAVLLHDHLPDEFTSKFSRWFDELGGKERGGSFQFLKVELGEFTAGDERFFHFRDYLAASDAENVFIVDVSDAWFHRDPFRLLTERAVVDYLDYSGMRHVILKKLKSRKDAYTRPKTLAEWFAFQKVALARRHKYRLFIGGQDNYIGANPWILKHYDRVYGERFPHLLDKPVLNCGIIGGSREDVHRLLTRACNEMDRLNVHSVLNDMVVFNKILYEEWGGLVYSNGVLNSPWKRYEKRGRYCIFHK